MITLSNDQLTIKINEFGAELVSVVNNDSNYEFMWQGDSKYWSGTAPVLFPIVGKLKDNQYCFEGENYELPQHGFARRMMFQTQTVTDISATFYLKSNQETLKVYPFEFSFQITYILFENKVSVSYEILNTSASKALYYSVGGHPGFNVAHHQPETGQPEFVNVSYSFEPVGSYLNIPLTERQIDLEKAKYLQVNNNPILHKTFKKDAQIFLLPKGTKIILNDPENNVKITMTPNELDFLGIWSSYPKKAGFVCVEPWSGVADTTKSTGQLIEKYGINKLEPSTIKTHDYTIQFDKSIPET